MNCDEEIDAGEMAVAAVKLGDLLVCCAVSRCV